MSKKLCFIDDDRNELERFKQAIASDELIVGTGTMGGEALNDIAAQGKRRFLGLLPPSRHVDPYVLDMYYPTGGSSSDAQLSKLGKAWDEFRAAEARLCRRTRSSKADQLPAFPRGDAIRVLHAKGQSFRCDRSV